MNPRLPPRDANEWTPGQQFFRNGGVLLMLSGCALVVLSFFGLTLRKFAAAGVPSLIGAGGLIAIGALLFTAAHATRTATYRVVRNIIAVGVLAFGVMLVGLAILLAVQRNPSTSALPPGMPPMTARPRSACSSAAGPRPSPTRPPAMTAEEIRGKFGDASVVTLRISGIGGIPVPDLRRSRIGSSLKFIQTQAGAQSFDIVRDSDMATATYGPVTDIAQFAGIAGMFFERTGLDPSARTVDVKYAGP